MLLFLLNSQGGQKVIKDKELERLASEMDKVYLALGRAISDWGKVEQALCRVFTSCFPIEHSAPAGHAFHEPRSFMTQHNMTSRAVHIAVLATKTPDVLAERWSALSKELTKANSDRNKLAHGSVVCEKESGEKDYVTRFASFRSSHSYDKGVKRSPTPDKAKKLWTINPKVFTADELGMVSAVFYDISERLNDFANDFANDLSLTHNKYGEDDGRGC
jgi:hypothetical protein